MSFWQQSKNSPAVARMSWSTSWPHCITMWLFLALSVLSLGGLASIAALRSLSTHFIYFCRQVTWCFWQREGMRHGQSARCETWLREEGFPQAYHHMRQEETWNNYVYNDCSFEHLTITCDKACWRIQMKIFVDCYKFHQNSCTCCPRRINPASCTCPLFNREKVMLARLGRSFILEINILNTWKLKTLSKILVEVYKFLFPQE